MENRAYVYILLCADNSYYTGWTNNPRQRLAAHNRGKGAKYTRSRLPVKLLYLEELSDSIAAQKREYALKQLNHQQKAALIKTAANKLPSLHQQAEITDTNNRD